MLDFCKNIEDMINYTFDCIEFICDDMFPCCRRCKICRFPNKYHKNNQCPLPRYQTKHQNNSENLNNNPMDCCLDLSSTTLNKRNCAQFHSFNSCNKVSFNVNWTSCNSNSNSNLPSANSETDSGIVSEWKLCNSTCDSRLSSSSENIKMNENIEMKTQIDNVSTFKSLSEEVCNNSFINNDDTHPYAIYSSMHPIINSNNNVCNNMSIPLDNKLFPTLGKELFSTKGNIKLFSTQNDNYLNKNNKLVLNSTLFSTNHNTINDTINNDTIKDTTIKDTTINNIVVVSPVLMTEEVKLILEEEDKLMIDEEDKLMLKEDKLMLKEDELMLSDIIDYTSDMSVNSDEWSNISEIDKESQ